MSTTPHFTPPPYFTVEVNAGHPSQISASEVLYRAAHRGDWETTNSILQVDPTLIVAQLNVDLETVLHIAVGTGKVISYVKKLVRAMRSGDLELADRYGQTPLMVATIIGNIEAAKLLVHKNPSLLYVADGDKLLPVHRAAQYGQKDMLLFLLKVTSRDHPFPYLAESGAKLLAHVMEAEFYDVATSLIRCFPQLIEESFIGEHLPAPPPTPDARPPPTPDAPPPPPTPPMTMLAKNPSAFRSKDFWEYLLYKCVPINWQISHDRCIIGSTTWVEELQLEGSLCFSSKVVRCLRSFVQCIRPTKHIRDQAIQLVKCVCTRALGSSMVKFEMFGDAFLLAAENGIVEIVEELAETFPNLLWKQNSQGQNIFQVAVLYRHQSVYNLVYRIAKDKRYKTRKADKNGNNILHLAGKLAPLHRLNMVSGAAIQMRNELQWFKEVGKSIQPFQRSALNIEKRTPKEVFTEEHKALVIEGEKWMKSTATSCTTPAALIATVVFSAAILVPTTSLSKFKGEAAYHVFAFADALSLFASLCSLLFFLSVLTSRYTEDEFLYSLPRRILVGIFMLLISIESMAVAFSMILYLAFGNGKRWILDFVVTVACVPAALFVILHYSLLRDMMLCGEFPQISGISGTHPLYTRDRPQRWAH